MRAAVAGLLGLLAALPAARAEEPAWDWVLTFQNGDTLHCELVGVAEGRLTVRWQMAPDAPVSLALKDVAELQRAEAPPETPHAGADVLRLRDGSTLFGRAVGFSPKEIEFEVPPVGRLRIAAATVIELARGQVDLTLPDAKPGEHLVALRTGNVLSGVLATDEMGQLTLRSAGMTATLDYESITLVIFPRPSVAEEAATSDPVPGAQIRLRNGSLLSGRDPVVADGRFSFRLESGHDVKVPVGELAALTFLDYGELVGRAGLRSLLVWGRYADPGDEFRKTIAVLKEELTDRWTITESMATEFDAAFERSLLRARTLVIPEMEQLRGAPKGLEDAKALKPMLERFVRGGGNVVVLGVQNDHVPWVREAGLFDLNVMGQVDGQQVTFTEAGAKLAQGVEGGWQAVNATFGYAIQESIKALPLAETGGRAVVVGRRIGRGWIVCIGADFYISSDAAARVLANAVRLR